MPRPPAALPSSLTRSGKKKNIKPERECRAKPPRGQAARLRTWLVFADEVVLHVAAVVIPSVEISSAQTRKRSRLMVHHNAGFRSAGRLVKVPVPAAAASPVSGPKRAGGRLAPPLSKAGSPEGGGASIGPAVQVRAGQGGAAGLCGGVMVHPKQTDPEVSVSHSPRCSSSAHRSGAQLLPAGKVRGSGRRGWGREAEQTASPAAAPPPPPARPALGC